MLLAKFSNYLQPILRRFGRWLLDYSEFWNIVILFSTFSAGFVGGGQITEMTSLSFLDKMSLIAGWALPGLAVGILFYLVFQGIGRLSTYLGWLPLDWIFTPSINFEFSVSGNSLILEISPKNATKSVRILKVSYRSLEKLSGDDAAFLVAIDRLRRGIKSRSLINDELKHNDLFSVSLLKTDEFGRFDVSIDGKKFGDFPHGSYKYDIEASGNYRERVFRMNEVSVRFLVDEKGTITLW